MANLSQEKRQRMLDFLDTLRQEHKNDDDILIAVNEIETELTAKKYGLVWEQHEEAVDVMMRDNIPVFTECSEKEITAASDEGYNFILEGDNLHSLRLLEKTHAGKIDVIYIDPPYNTENDDFIYDDVYIDRTDGYRHSKWLSFMTQRLKLAKQLLKDDGYIMISIDDNEFAQLKLLCDEIFEENNRLSTHHIQVRYDRKNLNEKSDWQPVMEYVLLYAKNKSNCKVNKPYKEYDLSKFVFSFEELSAGTEVIMGGKRVTIFKKGEWKINKAKEGQVGLLKATWASGSVLKGNTSGRFFDSYIGKRKEEDGLCCLYKVEGIGEDGLGYRYFTGPQKDTSIRGKFYSGVPLERLEELENGSSKKFKPIPNLYDFSGDFGNIRHEGGIDFNSGKKPIKMLKQFINYHPNKNATVLDFFAGSGSTGHAVLELNKDDNGNRKFILCTNNENDICEEKTYPRLLNVMKGYANKEPLSGGLKYFRTDFVSKDSEELAEELLAHISEMVELENGIKLDGREYLILLSDEDADELERHWNEYPDIKALYVSKDVLFTTAQLALFSNVQINSIPDYYFKFELQEVGEAW